MTLACTSFIGGVVAANWVSVEQWQLLLFVVPVLLVGIRHKAVALAGFLLGLALLGCWRGTMYMQRLAVYNQLNGQKVTLQVVANSDAIYGTQSQLSFEAGHARTPHGPPLIGTIQVNGFGADMVYRGDTVIVVGKIYRARGNNVARVSFAQLQIVGRGGSPIDNFRRSFAAGMQSALPEPLASFGMGLLVGQRNTLPTTLATQLQMVGLTHIIAVSGYNLTIIMRIVKRLCAKRSRYQYLVISTTLVVCFLVITGLSPSIVRAAVVCGLSLATWAYGRELAALPLLSLSAVITVAANPLYAWNNVSWTLSFLAFFGVLVVSPILIKRLCGSREPPLVAAVIFESISAELMTIPYVLLIFGQISLVSTLANVLIAAWIPLVMLLTAVAGIVGMLVPAMVGWFAWPAIVLLTYMTDMTALLSDLPHVFLTNIAFSFWHLLLGYGMVGFVCFVAWHKGRQNGIITDRNQ